MNHLGVAEALMAAPLAANGWDESLNAMATLTRSSSGQIIGIGPARALAFNKITSPVEPKVITQFDTEVADYSSGNWRVASAAAPFELRHEYHYNQVRASARTELYDSFTDAANIPYGCQTVLLNQPGLMIGLAVLRSYSDGPTSEADRAAFALVAPYALAAARMQRALEEQGAQLIVGALEAMSSATFLCDQRGKVCAMTQAAEMLTGSARLITVRDDHLVAANPAEHRTLRLLLADMLRPALSPIPYRSLWLGMTEPVRSRRLCEIFALPQRPFNFGFEPRLMVTIRAAGDIAATEREALRTGLGLTVVESEIAAMLGNGISRDTIAIRRGTSPGTISIQIKRIFEKTGTGREGELVALIGRLLR